MGGNMYEETMVEKKVTHILEMAGQFIASENVLARVSAETGERFFSPETVKRPQQTPWEQQEPSRVIETAVFDLCWPEMYIRSRCAQQSHSVAES